MSLGMNLWVCCSFRRYKISIFSCLGMVSTTFVFLFDVVLIRIISPSSWQHFLGWNSNVNIYAFFFPTEISYLKYDWKLDSNCQFCRTTILQWMSRLSSSMLSVLLVFHRSFVDAVLRWFTWAIPVWALFSVSLFVLELFFKVWFFLKEHRK